MTQLKKHSNSRIVTLYRKDSFIMNAQMGTAPEFVEMAKKSLGSYWDNSYSKVIGSGLNFDEQKLLMPILVDCEPEDRAFREKCADYFRNIRTIVPAKKGRDFEIGLETDNSQPLSKTNLPINLPDYIAYRHALNHPLVAKDKTASEGDMLKEFYIFDPAAQEEALVKTNQTKNEALELYLKIIKTPEKIDMLLTLLDTDPRLFGGKNAQALKEGKLKQLAETSPETFVTTYNGTHFETLYQLQSMLNTGVLIKAGERIIDPETGDTLGHKTEEAIAWIKDKANSDRLIILKSRMQEGLSKPAPNAKSKK